jgi:hypothetical protein
LNYDTFINAAIGHSIANINDSGGRQDYFDGYLSDVYFIDGEALDPSRFGKQDADGIWQPITYTGSYGTNGFHLDFADNSTAAALGTDTSGNGNDWTPSGITTDDQVTDTPSVNYATLNPLNSVLSGHLSDGNLLMGATVANAWRTASSTMALKGKIYCEAEMISSGSPAYAMLGITQYADGISDFVGVNSTSYGYHDNNGSKYTNGVATAYGATYTNGDVIGIAFDSDTRELEFFKNGVSQGVAFTVADGEYYIGISTYNQNIAVNFGQRPFAYTPPTGFQALNSSNLPAPTITDGKAHFAPAQRDHAGYRRT